MSEPRYCRRCHQSGHYADRCPKPHDDPPHKKPCTKCYDMSHRVAGIRCVCGLRYAPEPVRRISEFPLRRSVG